jgi:hypothetical protein
MPTNTFGECGAVLRDAWTALSDADKAKFKAKYNWN